MLHSAEEPQKNQDRYRALVEQSSEGIWRCEIEEPIDVCLPIDRQIELMLEKGYIAECNEAMARMYGFAKRSDLIGIRLKDLFVPGNSNNQQFLASFVQEGYRLTDVDSVERDRNGEVLFFRNNLIGIVTDQKLNCAWGMQKNITQEVQTREGLRRSEERLRMASEAGGVGIWEWNVQTNALFWSDRVKKIFEFPLDHEPSMQSFREAVYPDDRQEMEQRINRALQSGQDDEYETVHRILAGGTIKWVRGLGKVFLDETGHPLRMCGTVVDITRSHTAECKAIQLRDVGSQLSKAMTLDELSAIVREFAIRTLEAKAVTIHSRNEKAFNLQLMLAHGWQEREITDLLAIAGDSPLPIARAGFKGEVVFQEGAESLCAIPLVLNQRILGAIGLHYAKPAIFDDDFQRFMLTFADQCAQAFERARLYETEKAARKEAEAANLAKSRFLANMSHEIRTPLGAIIGFAELLNEQNVNANDRSDCLNRILRNGHLLADMINDILDLSKIESEHLEVEHIDFELIPLVEEVMSLLRLKAQEKNLRLTLATVGNLPDTVHSDPTRLRQILINLLGNAIKFTERGSIEVRIASINGQLRFSVTDSGIGIPLAQQGRIFEPFMQADSTTTRKFGGTGLGLAVSRGLAQALNGELKLVKSIEGEGSVFSLTIEAGGTGQQPLIGDAQVQARSIDPKQLEGLSILVVDDNADNRSYISSFLSASGAVTATAVNGIQAIEMATQQDYDIVLMDIQMPELDGYSAIRLLRSQSYGKPVLALTAHAMAGDRENSLNAGFQDHLVKPVDRSLLIQTIQRYTGFK